MLSLSNNLDEPAENYIAKEASCKQKINVSTGEINFWLCQFS